MTILTMEKYQGWSRIRGLMTFHFGFGLRRSRPDNSYIHVVFVFFSCVMLYLRCYIDFDIFFSFINTILSIYVVFFFVRVVFFFIIFFNFLCRIQFIFVSYSSILFSIAKSISIYELRSAVDIHLPWMVFPSKGLSLKNSNRFRP